MGIYQTNDFSNPSRRHIIIMLQTSMLQKQSEKKCNSVCFYTVLAAILQKQSVKTRIEYSCDHHG